MWCRVSEVFSTNRLFYCNVVFFLHQDQGDKVTIATPIRAGTPFCQFEDVPLEGGRRATVLRENPAGRKLPIGDSQQVRTSLH